MVITIKIGLAAHRAEINEPLNKIRRNMNKKTREKARKIYKEKRENEELKKKEELSVIDLLFRYLTNRGIVDVDKFVRIVASLYYNDLIFRMVYVYGLDPEERESMYASNRHRVIVNYRIKYSFLEEKEVK